MQLSRESNSRADHAEEDGLVDFSSQQEKLMVIKFTVSSAVSPKSPINIDLPDGVSQGFQKIRGFLIETTGKAANAIAETTHQAVDTVTNTAEQASNSLLETTAGASHRLEDTIQSAERLNVAATESVQGVMNSFIREWVDSIKVWIDSHPVAFWVVQGLLWGIDHPILALVVVLLLVFILQRLLKALSYLVERALVSLLQAPFKFGRFLLRSSTGLLGRLRGKEATSELEALSSELTQTNQTERLATILTRLEVIRQEQDQLLQEVAAIVASTKLEPGVNGAQTSRRPPLLRLLFPNRSKDVNIPNHNDPALS